jgi:hypothetical protein
MAATSAITLNSVKDREPCLAAGMDLTKPIQLRMLLDLTAKYAGADDLTPSS